MPATDPFSQAYNAVWDALESWGGFAALVKLGNRVDFSERHVIKHALMPADVPEVSLVPAGFAMRPFGSNSKAADMSQSFQLVTVTEKRLIIPLNSVKYQTFVALLKAGADLGLPKLVRQWDVTGGLEGSGGITIAGVEAERGRQGFASLLTINVDMYQSREQLAALTHP